MKKDRIYTFTEGQFFERISNFIDYLFSLNDNEEIEREIDNINFDVIEKFTNEEVHKNKRNRP